MDQLIQLISLAVYGALAIVAVIFSRRQHSTQGRWAAAAFIDLALIVLLGAVLGETGTTDRSQVDLIATDVAVVLLLAFPYLLDRFVRALVGRTRSPGRVIDAAGVLMLVFTVAAPPFPDPSEPQPAWVIVYTLAFVVWWAVIFGRVAWRLWQLGRDQPGVVQGRMRLMAVAAVLMNIALVSSIGAGEAGASSDATQLIIALLGWSSALLFLTGLQPPSALRHLLRARDEIELRTAEALLLAADTHVQAAAAIIGPAAKLVGGTAGTVTDLDGRVLASTGRIDPGPGLTVTGSHSVVAVTPGRLTPLFGEGEDALLQQLCTHLDLAAARILALEDSQRLRVEAESATADLQQMVYGVSHDLRNPLVTITGFLNLLKREPETSERAIMLIERAVASADYMEGLVSDLLQLSRIGHADAERCPVALDDVIATVADGLGVRYPSMTLDISPLPEVQMNPVRAQQLLANLIENAARYAHPADEPVTITVRATTDGSWATVLVADDGRGIPPEQRDRVFQIFQRLSGFDSAAEGSGIGLTMCRRIVGELGGTIGVIDSAVGTTMRITLPLANQGAGQNGTASANRVDA